MDEQVVTHRHTPFYCEENVWWLAQDSRFDGLRPTVVVITNERRAVRMRSQRAARVPGAPVVWDYHVVLAVEGSAGIEVVDLDCTEGSPLLGETWLDASFEPRAPQPFQPCFRAIPAEVFVARFASDRRHMRRPDGEWLAEPPPWPIIGGGAHLLPRFVEVRDDTFGAVIGLDALRERWR